LPLWVYEGNWIKRKYKTQSWKSTLMVINTVGHLAEAAWHHPDITASYAWVEVRLTNHAAKGVTDKDFELLAKNFARIRNQLKITNDLLDKYKEYYETDVKENNTKK